MSGSSQLLYLIFSFFQMIGITVVFDTSYKIHDVCTFIQVGLLSIFYNTALFNTETVVYDPEMLDHQHKLFINCTRKVILCAQDDCALQLHKSSLCALSSVC